MHLLTRPVWNRDGWMCLVNLEDVASYVARGFSTTDPKGGTYTPQRERIDLDGDGPAPEPTKPTKKGKF